MHFFAICLENDCSLPSAIVCNGCFCWVRCGNSDIYQCPVFAIHTIEIVRGMIEVMGKVTDFRQRFLRNFHDTYFKKLKLVFTFVGAVWPGKL